MVITGMGVVSPLGLQLDEFFANLDRAFVRLSTSDPEEEPGKGKVRVKVVQEKPSLKITAVNEGVNYSMIKFIKQKIQIPMVHNVNAEGIIFYCAFLSDHFETTGIHCSDWQGQPGGLRLHGVRLLPAEERGGRHPGQQDQDERSDGGFKVRGYSPWGTDTGRVLSCLIFIDYV